MPSRNSSRGTNSTKRTTSNIDAANLARIPAFRNPTAHNAVSVVEVIVSASEGADECDAAAR